MGKHSKNNNDRAFFSYAERKAASYGRLSSGLLGGHNTADGNHVSHGWGTLSRTLDGDSMKEIDACSLSLQPCIEPVVTPSGILYDKQVVVEYILSRKKELERELREWEAQESGKSASSASEQQAAQQARIDEFVAQQEGLSTADLSARSKQQQGVATASTMGRSLLSADTGKHAPDTSFWVPQKTPEVNTQVSKPDSTVRCPLSGQPLRLKQLIPVKFTRYDDDKDVRGQTAKERYMCPLSKRPLSNVHPAAVLRPSGMVISTQSLAFVKKDMIDPFTEPPAQLKDKDIITLRVEGTGFAAKTEEKALQVKSSSRPAAHW